ncbi:MAG: hypothetical protein KGZ53_03830 [Peptococcaceae bacterium]|nr:hypothetical protein [Peptococcaceae bacterium]
MKLRAKLRRVQADLAWLGLICFVVVLVLRWALRADTSLRVVLAPLLVYLSLLLLTRSVEIGRVVGIWEMKWYPYRTVFWALAVSSFTAAILYILGGFLAVYSTSGQSKSITVYMSLLITLLLFSFMGRRLMWILVTLPLPNSIFQGDVNLEGITERIALRFKAICYAILALLYFSTNVLKLSGAAPDGALTEAFLTFVAIDAAVSNWPLRKGLRPSNL